MLDSHCHLSELDQPAKLIADASRVGVSSMLNCGYDIASSEKVLSFAEESKDENVLRAIGIHPWFANEPVSSIVALASRSRLHAIGEIGLDVYRGQSRVPLQAQLEVFECQLCLAAELGLPVSIHSRGAVETCLRVLHAHPSVHGAFHGFSGSLEQARQLLDRGWLLGVGTLAAHPKAIRLHRLVRYLPIDALLLETDSPFGAVPGSPPASIRPASLVTVLQAVAHLKSVDLDELRAQLEQNNRQFLPGRARAND